MLAGIAGLAAAAGAWTPRPLAAQYAEPAPTNQSAVPVPGTSLDRPRFSVDTTIQLGEQGAPEVRVDYRLNRGELLFERTPDGYRAGYEVRVIFYSAKGKRQITGDTFSRALHASTYAATRPIGEDIVDHHEFRLPRGKYTMEVAVTDLMAERTSGTSLAIEVPKEPSGKVWFSDLTVGTLAPTAASASPRDRLVPNPSRRFAEEIVSFAVYGEIVDNREAGPDSSYHIRYQVVDDADQAGARGDTTLARRGGRTPFLLRPNLGGLAPASYRFVVELDLPPAPGKGRGKLETIRRDKRFEIEQSKVSVGPDPKSSLDVLRYIATPAEIGEMAALKDDAQRQEFWETFWKRRDPTPDTPDNEVREEYYRRVQYANQHFGVAGPGWKTDMGRIYITYGRPDEVVRNPFNFDRPPEEIWYYYQDRRTYVFVDKDGFGRYELAPPGTH